MRLDEDLLLCDFAETYGVLDIRSVSPFTAGALAYGLRPDSRIKMKITDSEISFNQQLAIRAIDELAMIRWLNMGNASESNRPKMLSELFIRKDENENSAGYDTPEEFMRAYYGE